MTIAERDAITQRMLHLLQGADNLLNDPIYSELFFDTETSVLDMLADILSEREAAVNLATPKRQMLVDDVLRRMWRLRKEVAALQRAVRQVLRIVLQSPYRDQHVNARDLLGKE